jgi:hypothetical protein
MATPGRFEKFGISCFHSSENRAKILYKSSHSRERIETRHGMHGLDLILNKTSHLLVLRELYHAEEALTGRELQRRTGLSNRATMLALESLVDTSVVRCETTPQANWYEANSNNYFFSRALKVVFETEDMFWDDLRKVIRKTILPRPTAAVITGPLARNDAESSGRLEITMLFSSGRNRIRAFRTFEDLIEAVWERYALNVEANWLDVNSVELEEYETLWRRIEREGVLLFGTLP